MASKVRSICFRKFYRLTPKIYHCAAFAPLFAVKKWYNIKPIKTIIKASKTHLKTFSNSIKKGYPLAGVTQPDHKKGSESR